MKLRQIKLNEEELDLIDQVSEIHNFALQKIKNAYDKFLLKIMQNVLSRELITMYDIKDFEFVSMGDPGRKWFTYQGKIIGEIKEGWEMGEFQVTYSYTFEPVKK